MVWEKKGLVFTPNRQRDWIQSHAAVPIPVHLSNNEWRIFFGSRNRDNKTQTGYIDVEITKKNEFNLLYISREPVLKLGSAGLFDDSAAWASSIVQVEKDLWHMYYIGWMQGVSVPYIPSIGLAVSEDLEEWDKIHDAPIMGRDGLDPYGCASMSVMMDETAHYPMALNFKMWYLSILDYNPLEKMYYYTIRCAASDDGVDWLKSDEVAIELKTNETRIARPCVIKDFAILYRMWYCYATKYVPYRIGYAESINGTTWTRKDDEGLDVSKDRDAWDSQMVCYPYVFEHRNKRFMLYNGNDYGRTGIGYAIANFEHDKKLELMKE